MKSLIIAADLVNPPSESLAFRTLTLFTKSHLDMDNLIRVEQEVKDVYYNYMKKLGLHDFIDALVTPSEPQEGILLACACDGDYYNFISTDRVTFNNLTRLLGQIELASL